MTTQDALRMAGEVLESSRKARSRADHFVTRTRTVKAVSVERRALQAYSRAMKSARKIVRPWIRAMRVAN